MKGPSTFCVAFPAGTTREHQESVVRALSFTRTTAMHRLRVYDETYGTHPAAERAQDCEAAIPTFRALLQRSGPVEESRGAKRFFHFCLDYPEFVRISVERDTVGVNRSMVNGGGFVSEEVFHMMTDDTFRSLLAQPHVRNVYFVGCAEVVLTRESDVKRIAFLGVHTTGEERGALVEFLRPVFPDVDEVLTNDLTQFLLNPAANQTLLDSLSRCAHCGQEAEKLRCARCKRAYYCGAPCQNAHWKSHKQECTK